MKKCGLVLISLVFVLIFGGSAFADSGYYSLGTHNGTTYYLSYSYPTAPAVGDTISLSITPSSPSYFDQSCNGTINWDYKKPSWSGYAGVSQTAGTLSRSYTLSEAGTWYFRVTADSGCLFVSDKSATVNVSVSNSSPTPTPTPTPSTNYNADFFYYNTRPGTSLNRGYARLDAGNSTVPSSGNVQYVWNFNDGSPLSYNKVIWNNPVYDFYWTYDTTEWDPSIPGMKFEDDIPVQLTIKDGSGNVLDTVTKTVHVLKICYTCECPDCSECGDGVVEGDEECEYYYHCPCPYQDGCVGTDYYDYPNYGDCINCQCDTGTGTCQPCKPVIYYNDSRCGPVCGNGILEAGETCEKDGKWGTGHQYKCHSNGTYYECNSSCEYDYKNKCETQCGSVPECDGFTQGTMLATCDWGFNYRQDYCNSVCGLSDGSCESSYSGCTADYECDEQAPGTGDCDMECNYNPGPVCGNGILEAGETCEKDGKWGTGHELKCASDGTYYLCNTSCTYDHQNYCLETCGADFECSEYAPGAYMPWCDFGASYLQDYCDFSCKVKDNHCESSYSGCTADPRCDEQTPGTGDCTTTCEYRECSINADCDDGLYCNGQEVCNTRTYTCESGTPVNCSHLDDVCNEGVCNETYNRCEQQWKPDGTSCNDGLFCTIRDRCDDGQCVGGGPMDCSYYNISGIATCFNNPDSISYTWDYRPAFFSVCNESTDSCTTGSSFISHNCDITRCGAECEDDYDCPCPIDGCIGPDYYDYPSYGDCLEDCTCDVDTTPCEGVCKATVYENDPRCGECFDDQDCDHLDRDYCSNNKVMHVEGVCTNYTCETNTPSEIENCGAKNGIMNDCGLMQWSCSEELNQTTCVLNNVIPQNQMCEGYCQGTTLNLGECNPTTYACQYTPTECNDGQYCNGQETCNPTLLTCWAGTPINCTGNNITAISTCNYTPDGIAYTWDWRNAFTSECNEATDSCTTGDTNINHECSQSCGAECTENTDCTCEPDGCIGPNYYDYPTNSECLGDCTCETCTPTITYNDPRCGECVVDGDCDDGLYCNGQETCSPNYTCMPGTPINCDDAVNCTIDSCNETTDTCNNTPDNTVCDDGLYCNGIETCNPPFGCWAGAPVNCSDHNLPAVGQCDYSPDGIAYTWDYFIGFTSVCDEAADACTIGTENVTSECDMQNCGAECEEDTDCGCGTDVCIGNDYYDYPEYGECTEGCACVGCEPNILYDDQRCNPPETLKTVGEPKIACDYFGEEDEAGECWYITTDTTITFTEVSGNSCEENTFFYRVRWKSDFEDEWDSWSEWQEYTGPFTFSEYSIHELEYYASGCDVNEEHKFEIDIVDSRAPTPIKVVGEPSEVCPQDMNCEFKITMDTPIDIGCEDRGTHPVGVREICYRYFLDGDLMQDWTCSDENIEIIFDEECFHQLDFYCVDELGNTSETDSEIFKVEGEAFTIPLYKKWNLISIPYVPLDSDVELVFGGVMENVESIWAYENDQWLVYRPGNPGASTLTEIMPGYGYWVSMYREDSLLFGGSLFSPAEVPPSRDLKAGWNLIGYYGTYGLEQNGMEDWDAVCGQTYPETPIYGSKAYCALGSLITSPGNPKVSSLWSYSNCGGDLASWAKIDLCIEDPQDHTKMYAGRGYWAFINEDTEYAPSTVCIWDEAMICPVEAP